MNTPLGRSVRLYLAEGTASGLTTAEIMNWTGHVLTGSRSGLPAMLERPELDRTGIYFLVGTDPEDADSRLLYIGESDNVRKRLVQHSKDEKKDFWERTCVVTSKDQNITKAHARYLESRLIAIAFAAGTVGLVNGTAPPLVALPEADASDMEFFIEQLRLILPVIGFDFMRKKSTAKPTNTTEPTPKSTSPVFQIVYKKYGIEAQAQEVDGEFMIFAGSGAKPVWTSKHVSYAALHAKLLKTGKLQPHGDGSARFAEDVVFSSPSAAAAVVRGQPANGRTDWKVSDPAGTDSQIGETYAQWQERQVEAKASAVGSDDDAPDADA